MVNFSLELHRVPAFRFKPEPPALGERVQLSYYNVERTATHFVISNIYGKPLGAWPSDDWDGFLRRIGAWRK